MQWPMWRGHLLFRGLDDGPNLSSAHKQPCWFGSYQQLLLCGWLCGCSKLQLLRLVSAKLVFVTLFRCCAACSAGQYSTGGSMPCTPCPAGDYPHTTALFTCSSSRACIDSTCAIFLHNSV